MISPQNTSPFATGWDFTDPDVLERGLPVNEFAWLRKNAPVWWNDQPDGTTIFDDGGYWVVSRHDDIRAISKDPAVWSTKEKGAIMKLPDFITLDQLDFTKALLINHDPPEHTRLRKIISRLFTPKAVSALHDQLQAVAADIVTRAADKGSGNFVEDIAIDLPLTAIFNLLGVPEADRAELFSWSNVIINTDDPAVTSDEVAMANADLLGYAYAMAEDRRKNPADDIITTLVEADIDGESIDETEFGFFVILLVVAGNETTRNAITHGMNAFFHNPDQWELFKRERPKTTADEIVRWATPVNCFQRTALVDTRVGGVPVAAGQRVGLFYGSANYDEAVFDDPFSFTITRDPNPHLGFGGSGTHFCIGSNLARMEIDIMMNTIADILPDIHAAGEPVRVRSGWLNGVKELQAVYR